MHQLTREPARQRLPVSNAFRGPVQRCGTGSGCDRSPGERAAGGRPDVERATAGGTPLPTPVRAAAERAFAHDFSAVRIHTGPRARWVVHELQARALTAGTDVLFAAGAFKPGTPDGDRLIHHELAHVVQQAHGLPSAAIDGGPTDPLEIAAETAAERTIASGTAGTAPLGEAPEPDVRRGGAGVPATAPVQRFVGPAPGGAEQAGRELARRALQSPVTQAGWRQFWRVVARRFALRGAVAAALAAVDGPLPVGDLISLGLALWTIWEIIDLWDTLWQEAIAEAARQVKPRPEILPAPERQPEPAAEPEPAEETRPRPVTDTRTREKSRERCPVPVNELTEFVRWGSGPDGSRTAGGWMQELVGDELTDWTGCEVFEEGTVDDQCWVPTSPCRQETVIDPPGSWTCSGNEWGLDFVGTGETCVDHYQRNSRLPCRITAEQTMYMQTDRGPVPYKQNQLYIEIHANRIVSSRDGEVAERAWPPP